MEKTTQLLSQIPSVVRAIKAQPNRKVKLRVCRVGPTCPACGGAAWVQAKPKLVKGELKFRLPTKPRPECKPMRMASEGSKAVKTYLKRVMPAWAADLVSL
jgi:hypothetical protein